MDELHAMADQLVARASSGTGSSRNSSSSSLSAFLCTLIPLLLINAIYITLFLIFRRKYRRIYEPRSYLGSIRDVARSTSTRPGFLTWVKDFYAMPDIYVLNSQSLDGYLYLRFYKMLVVITFVGCLITWPILFPVNATGGAGQTGFNILSFSNIVNPNRYYAHTIIAWIYFTFIMAVIAREILYFIHVRQAYLLSPRVASRISSRTVIFTDVPRDYLNYERLQATFPEVKHIWLATDAKDLDKLVEKERDKNATKLEGAIVKISKTTNDHRLKLWKKKNQELSYPVEWADAHARPQHRLKPLIGEKVDTLDYCREQLDTLIPKVEHLQARHYQGQEPKIPAVFIEFETVQAAQSAYQQLVFHTPKKMQARAIGVRPDQVLWNNLSVPWWRREILYAAATALVCLLIFFWSPITAFVGFISNINYLESYSWLSWVAKIPSAILGVITGLLPSVLLAVVVALVPIIMKQFAKHLAGAISTGEVELMVQAWYFWFQVIIVFLLTTFTSGASSVITSISQNPGQAPSLLAENLPTASNFYISYFIVFGLGTSAQMIFNVVAVALYIILGKLLDKTPRKKFNRYVNVSGISWGSTYPKYTTLGVIAITYSCIAPLLLGFATVGLALLYIAFRYELIYTLETSNADTQGATYVKALHQLIVGVYLAEICMIGLFAIHCGSSAAASGPLILMIIFLIITILFHIAMRKALKPYVTGLPRDLLADSIRKQGVPSQVEMGNLNRNGSLGQDQSTYQDDHYEHLMQGNSNVDTTLKTPPNGSWFKRTLFKFLHPDAVPQFAHHLSVPLREYTEAERKDAYFHPAITSPTPLLWIVRDEMGVSAREMELTSNIVGVSDRGASWDEKGNMRLVWQGMEGGEKETNALRQCPVWEDRVEY